MAKKNETKADAPATPAAATPATHLIPAALATLADCCAADHGRFTLTGVRLAFKDDGTYLAEATDGRILARVEGDAPKAEGTLETALKPAANGAAQAVIPAKAFRKALKNAKAGPGARRGAEPAVAVAVGEKTTTIAGFAAQGVDVSTSDNIEGRFPDTDGVFPKGEPAATVTVNASMLINLLRAAEAACWDGGTGARVTLAFNPPKDGKGTCPMAVKAQNGERRFSGLIMPCS